MNIFVNNTIIQSIGVSTMLRILLVLAFVWGVPTSKAHAEPTDIQKEAVAKVAPKVILITLKKLAGTNPTPEDINFVRKLMAPQMCITCPDEPVQVEPEQYLNEVANLFQPYYRALVNQGAEFKADAEEPYWDLDQVLLNHEEFNDKPKLAMAVYLFFSPRAAKELYQKCRTQPVIVGDYIFPPGKGLRGLTLERWKLRVQNYMDRFGREMRDFAERTAAANTWWGATVGYYWRDRGEESPDQIAANSHWRAMMAYKKFLWDLGIPDDSKESIIDAISKAAKFEGEAAAGLMSTANRVALAAIAAPVIPFVIYAAPFAGALVGVEAVAATNAAATFALFPAALGLAYSGIGAGIDNLMFDVGNGFWRDFVNYSSAYGAGGLIVAPFLAAIPSGIYLASAMTGGVVALNTYYATGAVGQAFGTYSVVSSATVGIGNITAALGFISYMGYSAYVNIDEAVTALNRAKELAKQSANAENPLQAELLAQDANREFANASRSATFAAVDIVFFSVGGVKFVRMQPIKTLGRLTELVRIRPLNLNARIPELGSKQAQLEVLEAEYGSRAGAKKYWGDVGEVWYDAIKAEAGEAFANRAIANPEIAPFAETAQFRAVIAEINADATVGLSPAEVSARLGTRLGNVTVYRALRLDANAIARIEAEGLKPGAIRNGIPTSETFRGMLMERLGGRIDGTLARESVPEAYSNYNSVTSEPSIANAVASCESGVARTGGRNPIYLLEMSIPRNQIVTIEGRLQYPTGSYWANLQASGSRGLTIFQLDSNGRPVSQQSYGATPEVESFLFGEVPRGRITNISVVPEHKYGFNWTRQWLNPY